MQMPEIELSDIQGFVMRTSAMPALRVLVLEVVDAPLAARFLRALASGDPSTPQLTTAAPWASKPEACVNIAFTHRGLAAMQLAPLPPTASRFICRPHGRPDFCRTSTRSATI